MNYSKLPKAFLVLILTLSVGLHCTYGQNAIAKRFISENDREQLEQAKQINQQAAEHFKEAEALYTELEKEKKKDNHSKNRMSRLRERALKKDIEGFEKKKKANQLVYSVYKRHYSTFQASEGKENADLLIAHLQYEQAGKSFYRAAILRNEAYNHVKDLEGKFSKLEKAQHIEQRGLKDLKKALNRLYEKKIRALRNTSRSISPDERVVINESLLREIRKALKQYEYEPTIYSELTQIRRNDTVSFARIRDILLQHTGRKGISYDSAKRGATMKEKELTVKTSPGEDQDPEEKEGQGIGEESNDPTSVIEQLNFRVQIATDRNSLSQGELKKLYSGNKKIYSIRESGWHKYLIGQFTSYQDACRFRKELKLKDAFVVAFKGEKSVAPSEILKDETPSPDLSMEKGSDESQPAVSGGEKKTTPKTASEGIDDGSAAVFRVQIAADRIRLEQDKLHSIYSGGKKVHVNKAKGWYRYAVGTCPTYNQAKRLQRYIPVKGSWIVAYKNGKRYNGYRMRNKGPSCPAPTIQKKRPQQKGLIFKVQIAASRVPLTAKGLKPIYCGGKVVTQIRQDKYYKYSIGTYDNYQDAARLKKDLCVPGAFVVAFKQGRPLDIQEAISQNK